LLLVLGHGIVMEAVKVLKLVAGSQEPFLQDLDFVGGDGVAEVLERVTEGKDRPALSRRPCRGAEQEKEQVPL